MSKSALGNIFIAVALLWPAIMKAGPKSPPLNEDAAINALLHTLQRDHVYEKRISLDCVTFGIDNTTRTYFEVALHEKHNKKCGGDPETSPVVDRYRVNRASGKLDWYNLPEDRWKPYDPAQIR